MSNNLPVTVLGAGGWIGSALVAYLQSQFRTVRAVGRVDLPQWLNDKDPQGAVIYTIGLTADFREQPHATVEAHVSLLSRVLRRPGIQQLLFLSSSRVYSRSVDTHETASLPCLSSDPSDIYNLSKLLGEALVLQDPRPGFRVVRLSNVVGPGQPVTTFVGALLEEAYTYNEVTIQQPSKTTKNYVALADVVRLLPMIAEQGRHRIYNIGSSINTSHSDVAAWLEQHGVIVKFASCDASSSCPTFQPLMIDRLTAEYMDPGDPFKQFSFNKVPFSNEP